MLTYFGSYGLALWVGSVLIVNSRSAMEQQYPLNTTTAPSFCRVGAVVPYDCADPPAQNGTLTFGTAADVCACVLCECGCYPNGPFGDDVCVTGGNVLTAFFAVVIGAFGIVRAASRSPRPRAWRLTPRTRDKPPRPSPL